MGLTLSHEHEAFRDEVRRFLDLKFTPDLREAAGRQAGVFADAGLNRRWHRILFEQGWIAPAWPVEYGGTGWSFVERYIFELECAAAGVPALPAMGLRMCGPVIMRYGTEVQKQDFLPKILSGEHYWCQGYSEPGSGSDLASLQTRAVREGDDYIVNGSKIWTTHAHVANWIFLLVRTATEGKPQAGITFLVAPLDLPGITVQPIITMSGEHEVNQVFFEDVRIPVANRMGPENGGWGVAKYLLEFERGGGAAATGLRASLGRLRQTAQAERSGDGASLWDDPDFRRRFAQLDVEVMTIDASERRMVSGLSAGKNVGDAAASMMKLASSEAGQRINTLALEAIAYYVAPDQRAALGYGANGDIVGPDHVVATTARYLNNRAATVFGGSSEVQRNILARAALGL